MRKVYGIFVITTLFLIESLSGDNRVVLLLKHAPAEIRSQIEQQEAAAIAAQPDGQAVAARVLKPDLSGVAAMYGGYFMTSSKDGTVTVPLRHASQGIQLVITPTVDLVNVKGNTFSHRALVPAPNVTKIYAMKYQKDDKGRFFWDVKEDTPPADGVISPTALVLLTPPENVVVAIGKLLAAESQQLVLPDVYLLGRKGNDEAYLRALDKLKPYCESVTIEQKTSETSVQEMVKNI